MKVIRKRLWEEEVTGNIIRWSVAGGYFETYDPATDTWNENPLADPRLNPMYLIPPRSTGDVRCDAAANMRAAMEEILDQFFLDLEIVQLINAIVGVIAVFQPGWGLLVAVVIAFIEAIIEIGVASILFAFSDEQVWVDIQCALYAELDDNGAINASGVASAQSTIEGIYPGSVIGLVTSVMFSMLGLVGLNNAGAAGDETGDCSDCECDTWCREWTSFGEWTQRTIGQGTWSSVLSRSFPSETTLTSFEMWYEWTGSVQGDSAGAALWTSNNLIPENRVVLELTLDGFMSWTSETGVVTQSCGGGANRDETTGNGTITITKIRLRGLGCSPFGGDNCTD